MERIRFIHSADIHLGSFLHINGQVPEHIQRVVRTATMDAFRRICDAAIEHEVNFIVISGDLYDREARSVAACRFFVEECKRLSQKGIQVFVIAGNHDPIREQPELFELPENVRIFGGDKPEIYPALGKNGQTIARVIGQSYLGRSDSRKMHVDYQISNADVWNIALLHTQLDLKNLNYVPCSLSELEEKQKIHYWALGHIHKNRVLSKSFPVITYSGIPQGRDFGEEGAGGCILVELDPFKSPKLDFIVTSSVIFKKVDVWIDQDPSNIPETISELEDMISSIADDIIDKSRDKLEKAFVNLEHKTNPVEGYIVQWVIRGRGKIHDILVEQKDEISHEIVQELRKTYQDAAPFLWTDSVDIKTQKVLPCIEKYENSPFFRELNKVVEECLENEKTKKQVVKELGKIWDDRGDYENMDECRFLLVEDVYRELIESARQLVFERLVQGEE